MNALYFLIWGIVAHIVADWFLQNEWMAINKTRWRHPAAWVHSGLHLVALLFVFPPLVAVLLAASHFLIDLRTGLMWWRRRIGQTVDPSNPITMHIQIWQDQGAHVLCLALAAVLTSRL